MCENWTQESGELSEFGEKEEGGRERKREREREQSMLSVPTEKKTILYRRVSQPQKLTSLHLYKLSAYLKSWSCGVRLLPSTATLPSEA